MVEQEMMKNGLEDLAFQTERKKKTQSGKLNIFNHAHNLLIDIGKPYLKKETLIRCRGTLVFYMILNICLFNFVDCLKKNSCVQSQPAYAFVFICVAFWTEDSPSCFDTLNIHNKYTHSHRHCH